MDFEDKAVEVEICDGPDAYRDAPDPPEMWSLDDFDDLVECVD